MWLGACLVVVAQWLMMPIDFYFPKPPKVDFPDVGSFVVLCGRRHIRIAPQPAF